MEVPFKEAVSQIYPELHQIEWTKKIAAEKVKGRKKNNTANTKGSADGQTEEDCNGLQFAGQFGF